MAELAITLRLPLPREVVWRRLWSASRHTASIPLTVVTSSAPEGRLDVDGALVRARTTVGPWGFDDDMETVAVATPEGDGPWQCRIVKRGKVVHGAIDAVARTVELPGGRSGTELRWRQRITVTGMPRVADPLTAAVAWVAYRTAISRIVSGEPDARHRR
ncbi:MULTISPECIES: hypothetical protein [Arsenicicoccus]|uniref:SRPBCC family protein n=1 Tax=Arsenicicoccus bolidensis TaxID=229480 RepID=A0ABS9PZV1_9MICO|nr:MULTISPECIES: hypothetical protein [Arsenicicoccus]MCG7321150.1 hypothetical protein [Arsenicicoccus bolidensis]